MTDQGPPGGLPIRTEVFFTEDGRARLAKGALQTIGRSRGVWILLALALLYVAFFFFLSESPPVLSSWSWWRRQQH
ncbi:hypothetical protein Isolate57596_31260 [Mycobacteroides abscessus subsp. abscessus]